MKADSASKRGVFELVEFATRLKQRGLLQFRCRDGRIKLHAQLGLHDPAQWPNGAE